MSQWLEYQQCFNQFVHEAVITTMVISPDGRRLVMASSNSTVVVWSTHSGVTLC
jgi:WD40 repeat protein